MQALLRQVDVSAKRTNRFLGTDVIDMLKAKLTPGAPTLSGSERFQILGSLAVKELRLGRLDDSIQHHLEGLAETELLLAAGERVPPRVLGDAHFQLGVTYMRQGEIFNCCNIRTPDSCILPIQGSGIHTDESGSRAAIEEFKKVLEIVQPNSLIALKARWALNITNMTLGTWPESVPEPYRIAPEVFASEESFPRFTEVAQAKSVAYEGMAGGSVVQDFTGDGGWEDRTVAAGLSGLTGGLNMVQGDYDNDGDVYILRGAWWRDHGRHPKSLIQNDGRGDRRRQLPRLAAQGRVPQALQGRRQREFRRGGRADRSHFGDRADGSQLRRSGLRRLPDMYLATGYPFYEGLVPHVLYHNQDGQ